jgi:multiple sugar transport system permease protein
MNAAIFMEVWKTTPFVALLLIAGLQTIDGDLYESARVDGASGWYTRRITVPLLMPVILIVLIFRTLDAFRVFDSIYVLTGGGLPIQPKHYQYMPTRCFFRHYNLDMVQRSP